MDYRHDSKFFEIYRQERNLLGLLDSFFGFLYRCTDFYVESTFHEGFGLAPNLAEQLVIGTMRKWKNLPAEYITNPDTSKITKKTTTNNIDAIKKIENPQILTENVKQPIPETIKNNYKLPEHYNGASYKDYSWSQSINDLEVFVRVPQEVQSSKQLSVKLCIKAIEVTVLNGPDQIVIKGELYLKIKKNLSFWVLDPGRHVNFHLEKAHEGWWPSLLVDEPPIDLCKIDCTRTADDMNDYEQAKLEQFVRSHQHKSAHAETKPAPQPQPNPEKRTDVVQRRVYSFGNPGSPFKDTRYYNAHSRQLDDFGLDSL